MSQTFLNYDYSVGRDWHDYVWPYSGEYGNGSARGNRFWPAPDDNDFADLSAFSQFFTDLPNNGRYYDVAYGPLHLFFLDSAAAEPDGNTANSKQARWLQTALMLSTARWKVVVVAAPPFSSDNNTQNSSLQWPFEQWGADAVFAGTSRDYERFSVNRFTYIVNGLGGVGLLNQGNQAVNSVKFYAGNYGAGKVTVSRDRLRYEFYAIDGTLVERFELTKGTSTMKPPIPTTCSGGAGPVPCGVIGQQVLHGPWLNPNGNTTPPTPANGAFYTQDGVTPANIWSWDVENQIWVVQSGPASYINYAGPPLSNPPALASIVVDSNGQQWEFYNNQWN